MTPVASVSRFSVGSILSPGMRSSLRQDWATPTQLFYFLNREFEFDFDACATRHNAKCANYYDPRINSLSTDWASSGKSIWCNPPYGRSIGEWIRKGYETSLAGSTVVMLLPARTDTVWFHSYCLKAEIRFLRGRLRFDDERRGRAPFPSMIVVFRAAPSNQGAKQEVDAPNSMKGNQ